jgi:hypothetical protein
VLRDLLIPHVSNPLGVTLSWNVKVQNYVVSIFGFTKKFLVSHRFVLLFHDDDFQMLREIKSYLETYGFKIQSNFFLVNFLKQMNPKFKEKKVAFFLQPHILCYKCFFFTFCIYVLT